MEQRYMDKALELAAENVLTNGKPFGAVIVKDGKVLALGVNEVVREGDPTAHAEIKAIQKAGIRLGEAALNGAVMYASGHPCPMCLAAMHLAGFEKIYYYSSLEEVEGTSLDVSAVYSEMRKPLQQQNIPLIQMESGLQANPIADWLKENG